jgi:hypothetical protein
MQRSYRCARSSLKKIVASLFWTVGENEKGEKLYFAFWINHLA